MKKLFAVAVVTTSCVIASFTAVSFDRVNNVGVNTTSASSYTTETTVLVPETKVEIVTNTYKINSGDTLLGISQTLFGSESYLPVIYGQNVQMIENTAQSHGFASSDSGHWIFTGSTLSISIPVVTQTLVAVPTETTVETSVSTATVTSTATATPTSSQTPVATATTSSTTATATSTAVETATATETLTVVTSTTTTTKESVATETSSVTPTATAVPFTFSPILPVDSDGQTTFIISTYFGQVTKESPNGHRGVDITSSNGTSGFDIHAIEEGEVIFSGWGLGGYGYEVKILHPNGLLSLYGHLGKDPDVKIGNHVDKGQVIGKMGNTGYSTGPHLHIEVQDSKGNLLNPSDYLDFSKLNSPPEPTPTAVPIVIAEPTKLANFQEVQQPLLRGFAGNYRWMQDQLIWSAAVEKNQQKLRDVWIWNSAVAASQRKQAEDIAIAGFLLLPLRKVSDKTYTVQKGDTLAEISDAASVDQEQLSSLNNLADPNVLEIGQVIRLPEEAKDVVIDRHKSWLMFSISYPNEAEKYVNYLKGVAASYGSDISMLLATMGCENYTFNPNVDYIDSDGTETAGIGQFKIGTYQSAARRMGLTEAEIANWKDPFNQLKVMAWRFAVGEAGAWTGYRNLVNYGRCR